MGPVFFILLARGEIRPSAYPSVTPLPDRMNNYRINSDFLLVLMILRESTATFYKTVDSARDTVESGFIFQA